MTSSFYLIILLHQVHKEPLEKIPNAIPARNDTQVEIYGVEGIPEDDLRLHQMKKGVKSEGC